MPFGFWREILNERNPEGTFKSAFLERLAVELPPTLDRRRRGASDPPPADVVAALRGAVIAAVKQGHLRAGLLPLCWEYEEQEVNFPEFANGTDIVIPIRGAHDHLRRAMASLEDVWHEYSYARCVAQDSEVGAIEALLSTEERDFTSDIIVSNPAPMGFAEACNWGLLRPAQSSGYLPRRVIFLNSDAALGRYSIQAMMQALDMGFAAAGPWGTNISGFQHLETDDEYIATHEKADALTNSILTSHTRPHGVVVAPFPRLVGFCLAVDTKAFLEVGAWDEVYGVGNFDDDDLSLRLALAYGAAGLGWCQNTVVSHAGHATFHELGKNVLQESMSRNEAIFRERWEWLLTAVPNLWAMRGQFKPVGR